MTCATHCLEIKRPLIGLLLAEDAIGRCRASKCSNDAIMWPQAAQECVVLLAYDVASEL